MKKLLERIARRGAATTPKGAVAAQETPEETHPASPQNTEAPPPVPKLPPELPLFFMLSHLEDDGPVRLDGVKLGVCEVMGLEIDEPKLGAFAGALNALDFPAQLLIRQHPPRLGRLRDSSARPSPATCPRRRRRRLSPSVVCSPTWRPATASSTGASTPSARRSASTTFAACSQERGCPSTS